MAINPAHCGEPALVPPTTHQPALHGWPLGQTRPPVDWLGKFGSVMYTSTPVRELA